MLAKKQTLNTIKTWMESNHINQNDLAERMNVSKSLVGAMLNGERNITPANLKKITKLMNVSIAELLGTDEQAKNYSIQLRGKATSRKTKRMIQDILISIKDYERLKNLEEK